MWLAVQLRAFFQYTTSHHELSRPIMYLHLVRPPLRSSSNLDRFNLVVVAGSLPKMYLSYCGIVLNNLYDASSLLQVLMDAARLYYLG